ncbi:tryptophan synthase beta subunit-like PLP-dependent enzyme [Mycena maculata]|uniref:cysteine synthase n=1 Tax=Mycena maculata TaxID=230809 RepID=A0AAD7KDD5_9AGAR|nr:tryptophan synthase beta subunit-like PLP-dependent enzyme [Mycena maculata]
MFLDFLPPLPRTARPLILGIVLGISLSISSSAVVQYFQRRRRRIALSQSQTSELESRPIELRSDDVLNGIVGLIGNTPLVRIPSLSDALHVEILAKAEFLNPGGSVKDRVAVRMIDDAERQGFLHPHTGSRIFEGTSGSTGISLAMVAHARGYDATIITPDDMAAEKLHALRSLGADVEQVRPASIVDKKQFVNIAKQRALAFSSASSESVVSALGDSIAVLTDSDARGFFADQFENKSNYDAHFDGTGPEVWRQTNGNVKAFVSGAGTGGTIAGVGRFLKSMEEDVVICLADPEGSGLYNKVKHGVMFDHREKEGTKRRHQVDTVVEGIGINRLTQNIDLALPIIDDAVRVTDSEAVAMARYLVKHDGLFVGSSSACNLVACVRLVKKMGWHSGERIVTVLCDSGARHYSKFWNDEYLRTAEIPIDLGLIEDMLASKSSA